MCAICEEMIPVSAVDMHSATCIEEVRNKEPLTMPVRIVREKLNESEIEHE